MPGKLEEVAATTAADVASFGEKKYWIKVNYDSGAAVTAVPRHFAEDSVSNGMQYKTATGELTPDQGGVRISGRVNGGPVQRVSGRLTDVHKVLMSASKCAGLGRNGFLTKGGGYLIPDDSALSHKIKKMIRKEAMKQDNKLIKLYEEDGVCNLYLQMKAPGSDVEVTNADGSWRKSQAHPWMDVGTVEVPTKDAVARGFPRQPQA
jgi:hypothetical protein